MGLEVTYNSNVPKGASEDTKALEKQAAKLRTIQQRQATAISSIASRVGSLVPSNAPLAGFLKDAAKIPAASGAASASLIPLGIGFGKVAAAAGIAAAAVISIGVAAKGIVSSVRAAADQEQAINQLAIAFQSTGNYSNAAVRGITNFAESLQSTTIYSDQAILRTSALLAQLGRLSGEGLKEATRATLDLAAGLGRELPVAALIMAKAAQGSTFELRKYGLVIDNSIPKTERWAAALQFVQRKFGGAAESQLRTFTGTIRALGNEYRQLLEVLGKPITDRLGPWIRDRIKEMAEFRRAITAFLHIDVGGGPPELDFDKFFKELDKFGAELPGAISSGRDLRFFVRDLQDTGEDFNATIDKMLKAVPKLSETTDIDFLVKWANELNSRATDLADAVDSLRSSATDVAQAGDTGAADKLTKAADLLQTRITKLREVHASIRKGLAERFGIDIEQSQTQIDHLLDTLRMERATPKQKILLTFDAELSGLEEQVDAQAARLGTRFRDAFDKLDVKPLEAFVEQTLSSVDLNNIDATVQKIREHIVQGLSFGDQTPAQVAQAKAILNILRKTVAGEKGQVFIDIAIQKQTVSQLQTTYFSLIDKLKSKSHDIITPDDFKLPDTLPALLKFIGDGMTRLKNIDPSDAIDAWNQWTRDISKVKENLDANTESGQQQIAMISAMQQEVSQNLMPTLNKYVDTLNLLDAISAQEKIVQLAFTSKDPEAVFSALDKYTELVSRAPKSVELDLNVEKFQQQAAEFYKIQGPLLETFDQMANRLSTEITAHINVKDFEGAEARLKQLEQFAKESSGDVEFNILVKLLRAQFDADFKQFKQQTLQDKVQILQLQVQLKNWTEVRALLQEIEIEAAKFPKDLLLQLRVDILRQQVEEAMKNMDDLQLSVERMVENIYSSMANSGLDAVGNLIADPIIAGFDRSQNQMEAFKNAFISFVGELIRQAVKLAILRAILGSLIPGGALAAGNAIGFALTGVGFNATQQTPITNYKTGFQPQPTNINIYAFDQQSVRKSLLTGPLGRDLVRAGLIG